MRRRGVLEGLVVVRGLGEEYSLVMAAGLSQFSCFPAPQEEMGSVSMFGGRQSASTQAQS